MELEKILKGTAIIIDDKIFKPESEDLIIKIRNEILNRSIPILEYEEIPEDSVISHFINISFILLDWELFDASMGSSAKDTIIGGNIRFIKMLREICFVPVFIFSNQSKESIKVKLDLEGLCDSDQHGFIFVKNKGELIDGENTSLLFQEIERWVKSTPSVYILKEWEASLNKAKKDLFWSFYEANHGWPCVLKRAIEQDGTDLSNEFITLISKNLSARMLPLEFDNEILENDDSIVTKENLRRVLEGERYLDKKYLPEIPFTGDIYKVPQEGKEENYSYFVNIRPDCDIIRNDNPDLYCLRGRVIDEEKINSENEDKIKFDKGSFLEKINSTYVAFIDDGKIIEFLFKELKIKKWNSIKDNRIGRLIPPYITKIQQRYSFYLQRQGLAGIPEKAILG